MVARNLGNDQRNESMEVGGLLGLLILIADVYAILKIAGSTASTGIKVIWIPWPSMNLRKFS